MPALIKKSIRHESNLIINYIRLFQGQNGLDITALFDTMTINEDIETGFVSGYLVFMDDIMAARDVYDGTETIQVSFASTDGNFEEFVPYEKVFRVIRYEHKLHTGTGNVRVTKLHFVSNPAVVNDSIKLRKMYTNTSASAFVDQCCDVLGVTIPRNIEETLHAKDFCAPCVSPLDMINWIKLTSQSKVNNGSDFYFFENRDGINFKSIDTLKSAEVKHTLTYKPAVDNYTYNVIFKMDKPKGYDVQDDMRFGGAGATLFTHDITTKQYNRFHYGVDNITRINSVNPRGETYEFNNDAYVQFWPGNQSYELMSLNSNTHSALLRSMSKTSMNFKTINVEIPGNVDIKSGDVIEVIVPSSTGIKIDESGKWLVKKLRHVINQHNFHTQLELASDGNIEDVYR